MPITGEQVLAHRKSLKLSRVKYAEQVGLTPTKIHNIEAGRPPRPEEEEALLRFMGLAASAEEQLPSSQGEGVPASEPPASSASSDDGAPGVIPSSGPVVLLTLEEEMDEDPPVYLEPAKPAVEVPEGTPTTWELAGRYDFKLPGYHVSNSELTCFRRCRRRWYLAYYRELGLKRPSVVGVRGLGTRLHVALSTYYSTRRADPMQVLEATIAEDRKYLEEGTDVDALDQLEKDADLARAMLEGYLEWVRETGADEGLDILGDEVVVEVPFIGEDAGVPGAPVALVSKMDVRIRRAIDGARLFMDHKSVGNFTQPAKTLHLDTQMLHYHLMEHLEFLQAGMTQEEAEKEHSHGGLYNMLRRVKRTATAKPPFYDRIEVRHNTHELRSYYIRVWGEVIDIMETRSRLDAGADHRFVAYPHPDQSCSWSCDFLPVCPMFDDGSAAEELLADYYERRDPHNHYYPYGERDEMKEDA